MTNKINLVILHCPIRSGHFGMNTYIKTIIDCFRSSDEINITKLIVDDPYNENVECHIEEGIKYINIPRPLNNYVLNCTNNFYQINYAKRIADVIEFYIHDLNNLIFWFNLTDHLNLATQLKNRYNCKIIYSHHNWAWKNNYTIDYKQFESLWLNNRNFFDDNIINYTSSQIELAKLADAVISLTIGSSNLFETVFKIDKAKIYTIPNFLPEYVYDNINIDEIRIKYGIPLNKKIALYTGRIVERKGIFVLLEAFKKLLSNYSNILLVIIGDGDIDRVIKEANPYWTNILITGELNKDQIIEFYRIADFGILISLQEQSSYSALEMRMFKIPIIVSDVEGLGETFEDQIDCIKVPIVYNKREYLGLDPELVFKAMDKLINDNEFSRRIGNQSYKKYKMLFSNFTGRQKYQSMLANLLKG